MTDLDRVLAQAADLLPDTPDRLERVRVRRSQLVRRRRLLVGAAAALVAVGGLGAVALFADAPQSGRLIQGDGPTGQSSPSGDTQLYGASGRVVSVPGRPVRFCTPVAVATVFIVPRPAPEYCDFGVDVIGVNLAELTDRREQDGAVEGQASLTGALVDGVLQVVRQGQPLPPEPAHTYDSPPCPAPDGGWPRSSQGDNLDNAAALQAYRATHPQEVAAVALLRPTDNQVLAYLVTTGDVQAAETALRPSYGKRLCVFRSRFTPAELAAAQADPAFRGGGATQIHSFGGSGLSEEAQVETTVSATLLTPELEAAVARHPKGLVRLDLFLNPVAAAP